MWYCKVSMPHLKVVFACYGCFLLIYFCNYTFDLFLRICLLGRHARFIWGVFYALRANERVYSSVVCNSIYAKHFTCCSINVDICDLVNAGNFLFISCWCFVLFVYGILLYFVVLLAYSKCIMGANLCGLVYDMRCAHMPCKETK